MASGKFNQPRPDREEERQIEHTFRQITQRPAGTVRLRPDQSIEYTPADPQADPLDIPVDFVSGTQEPMDDVAKVLASEMSLEEFLSLPLESQEPRERATVAHKTPPNGPVSAPKTAQSAPQTAPKAPPKTPPKAPPQRPPVQAAFAPGEPDYEVEEEQDFLDKLLHFWDQSRGFSEWQRRMMTIALCIAAVALIVSFVGIFFASTADPYDGKILQNVYIGDWNIGGLTQDEATTVVTKSILETYQSQNMVVDLSGQQLILTPAQTEVTFNVKSAVKEAYNYGRSRTQAENEQAYLQSRTEPYVIEIAAYFDINTSYIRKTLTSYAQEAGSTLTQPSYALEGDKPELSAEKFNEKNPCQTLVITLGSPGVGFDVEQAYNDILRSYLEFMFLVEVERVEDTKEPDKVDLNAIYKELHVDPVEAKVDRNTGKTIPGTYGYTFDLEAAEKLLQTAQYGDVLRIPMEYIAPELLDDESFFRDVLAEYTTSIGSDTGRLGNIGRAAKAITGTVLNPGDTFSFNTRVGLRTTAKGYMEAPIDNVEGAEIVVGGGVEQLASTLYYAAVLADLNVTSRTSAALAPSFIEKGMDADVSNYADLTFRNGTGYPVQIEATVSNGKLKITLLGTEKREHYILLENSVTTGTMPAPEYEDYPFDTMEVSDGDVLREGVAPSTVRTYKVRYDRKTGKELSRELYTTTDYMGVAALIARVEAPPETTVPPTEAPTLPPVTEESTAPTYQVPGSTAGNPSPEATSPTAATQPEVVTLPTGEAELPAA